MNAEEILAGKVLLIDKPLTWSSFQAVNKLKYILKRKYDLPKKFKIGHAGTLISAILLLFRQKWRTSINRAAEAMTDMDEVVKVLGY